ncbi:Peptidyl-tRNA hydrolase ICT1 mitochondrial [Bienertia sinuspersici]
MSAMPSKTQNMRQDKVCKACGGRGNIAERCWTVVGYPKWHSRYGGKSPGVAGGNREQGGSSTGNSSVKWQNRMNQQKTAAAVQEHVTVNFARSGGPGGQNVNKVNTKVDMRFNVKNATWLSERVREKIMQLAIIDTAAYVPPPPTEEQKKKIAQL